MTPLPTIFLRLLPAHPTIGPITRTHLPLDRIKVDILSQWSIRSSRTEIPPESRRSLLTQYLKQTLLLPPRGTQPSKNVALTCPRPSPASKYRERGYIRRTPRRKELPKNNLHLDQAMQ